MDATQGPDRTPQNEPEQGSNAGLAASGGTQSDAAETPHIESPSLVPDQSEPAETAPAAQSAPAPTTALVLAPFPAKAHEDATVEAATKRAWRLPAMSSLAATIALALGIGATAGTLATLGLQQAWSGDESRDAASLRQAIAHLNGDVAALKAGMETSTKAARGLFARLTERLDRAERAQVEPAQRLAKISDAVERLEKRTQVAAVPPASIPAAPSPLAAARTAPPTEITGSVPPGRVAAKDLSRLPVIPGWALHSVYGDMALVSTRMGMLEIEVGDPLPGGGRVEAIRRDNGRWVVVTSRGLIVAR